VAQNNFMSSFSLDQIWEFS